MLTLALNTLTVRRARVRGALRAYATRRLNEIAARALELEVVQEALASTVQEMVLRAVEDSAQEVERMVESAVTHAIEEANIDGAISDAIETAMDEHGPDTDSLVRDVFNELRDRLRG